MLTLRARRRLLPVFSLGDHRRRVIGPSSNLPPDYFNAEGRSPETDRLRTEIRLSLEEEVAKYFRDNVGQVAIFDANVSALHGSSFLCLSILTPCTPTHLAERNKGGPDSAPTKV